jgi:P27 family predicted phage terminase small subunit
LGLRGPAPKPTSLVLLEGNPGRRPINRKEPKPRDKAPKCPEHLDERAKQEWKVLVPILKRMRVLSEADGIMLGNLCQAYSLLVKSQTKLNESGPLFKAPSGYPMANPLIGIINGCLETITKISREFGLTPASRTRIQVAGKDNASDDVLDF